MTKNLAELERELELEALPPEGQAARRAAASWVSDDAEQIRMLSPIARLGWVHQQLTGLGLPTSCLRKADEVAHTESDLHRRHMEQCSAANRRRQEALSGLLTGA